MPGFWELILLLIIVFIVFGARRLPALGEAIGRAVSGYKDTVASRDEIEVKVKQPGQDSSGEQSASAKKHS